MSDVQAQRVRAVDLALAGSAPSLPGIQQINPAFRLARPDDIGILCDMRCAQSLEYWDEPSELDVEAFRSTTERYLAENLGTRILFGLIEDGSEVASVAGLELNDRLPTLGGTGAVGERSATIVSCYTPKPHRGKGYMGQMLSIWMTLASLMEIDALYLESHNPSMQRMAEGNGYQQVSSKYRLTLESEVRDELTYGTSGRIRLDA